MKKATQISKLVNYINSNLPHLNDSLIEDIIRFVIKDNLEENDYQYNSNLAKLAVNYNISVNELRAKMEIITYWTANFFKHN